MENKVCTYTENKIKVNLVQVGEGKDLTLVLRYNRKLVARFSRGQSMLARYKFAHLVHEIVVLRDSSILSKITS